jgi:predicted dehydrogenase
MQKLEKVKWGIIGAGDVCEVKSGPALQNVENSELVAVMRRDGAKAADFAKRHGVPKWYDDADALIADPEINAIYIATPPNVHEDYAHKAAKAGKAVYVEKPMARNHEECQRMIDVCREHDVPLYVAFYRRSLPNYLKIKEILDNGLIGDIRYVNVKINKPLEPNIVGAAGQEGNWRTDPETAGGGYFYDLACHQLDLLDFLLGPIKEATGFSKNQGGIYVGEDITVGSFHFESGAMGQGVWCFNGADSSDEELTTIYGSKGQISFDYFTDFTVTLTLDGKAPEKMAFDIPKHIQQPLIQTIVNELTGSGQCPSTGVSGARTAWVMDQICRRID